MNASNGIVKRECERCRACLVEQSDAITLLGLVDIEEEIIQLSDLLAMCSDIKICQDDNKPSIVCGSCIELARISYKFKIMCEKSDAILQMEFHDMHIDIKNEPILCKKNDAITQYDEHKREDNTTSINNEAQITTYESDCVAIFMLQSPTGNNLHSTSDNAEETDFINITNNTTDLSEKKYVCNCGKTFQKRKCISNHQKTHCRLKNKLITKTIIRNMLRTVRPEKKWACECGKIFPLKKFMMNHKKSHSPPMRKLISRSTKSTDLINSANEWLCGVCGKSFKYHSNLKRHKNVHTNKTGLGISCNFCNFTSESPIKLGKHMSMNHEDEKHILCTICGKRFFTKDNLRVHLNRHNHSNVKQHICEVCGLSFSTSTNLRIHHRRHTGERPYKCSECDKCFTQYSSLWTHKTYCHSTKKNYACAECGAAFKITAALRKHEKIHSDARPSKCTICNRAFRSDKCRKKHMLVHTGEKNFTCDVCGKKFNRDSNLKVHVRIHTGETPHVCNVCGKGFIQAHCLRAHMKKHS